MQSTSFICRQYIFGSSTATVFIYTEQIDKIFLQLHRQSRAATNIVIPAEHSN